MKILITTSGGVVRGIKGWTEYALAKELIRKGHEVTVLTSSSVMNMHDAKKEETIDGIHVKRFHPVVPSSLLYMLKGDWDVINAHFPGYIASISSYAALRKKLRKIPVVHNVMGLYHDPYIVKDIQDPLGSRIEYGNMQKTFPMNPLRWRNWFSHLPLFSSDVVGALTSWEREELRKFGVKDEKMRIMPVGVTLGLYRKRRNGFREKHGITGRMILFIGQPIRRKGPGYLLRAMAILVKSHPDATAVFLGYKGNEDVEKECKKLGVEKNVKFIGYVPEEEKIAALQEAEAFVLPTLYEGFGIVFLEAMAAGCPVVTCDIAGVPEIVKHNYNGLLVKPRDEKDLAESIDRLISSKKLQRKVTAGGKKEVKKYDWRHLVDAYISAYEDAIFWRRSR